MLLEIFNLIVPVVGVLMSVGYFPQALRIIRNKSAKDVSLLMYIIMAVGTWVWLLYGILIGSITIILGFVVGVIGSNLVLALKLVYDRKSRRNK
jgi:MtN3 and saliva related transmembrane protein